MTTINDELNEQILKILEFDGDEKVFRLQVIELLSQLVSMMHWHRGLFYYLKFQGKFDLNEKEAKNYDRLLDNMSDYEKLAWEQLPSRPMTALLIGYRRGVVPSMEDVAKHIPKDPHGRIPYNLSPEDFDIIEKTFETQLKNIRGRRKAGMEIND